MFSILERISLPDSDTLSCYWQIPDILRFLSCFLARAVVDDSLEPVFLNRFDLADADLGMQVVKQAQHLLAMKRAAARLSAIWRADNLPSLRDLKRKIAQLH